MRNDTVSAAGIVVNPQGLIAIVEQRGPSWSLPKGGLEDGETPLHAAIREVAEETGLRDIRYQGALPPYVRPVGGGDEVKSIHPFVFTTLSTAPLQPVDSDNPSAIWTTPAAAVARLTHPADQEAVRRATPRIEQLAGRLHADCAEPAAALN